MTNTVRVSSSAKDEAPPSTSGAGASVGAAAGAAAGAGAMLVELLPKKSARGKSAASFFGFCLVQLKTAGTKVVEISKATCFAAATAVATVSVDFFSTASPDRKSVV